MSENPRRSYRIHLKDDVAAELDVESPVETDDVDYYDAGVWVARDEGRDFFPYRHVLTIRER